MKKLNLLSFLLSFLSLSSLILPTFILDPRTKLSDPINAVYQLASSSDLKDAVEYLLCCHARRD